MTIFLSQDDIEELVFFPTEDDAVPANSKLRHGGIGIYMLFTDDGRLQYVGKSICMHERITQHWLAMRYRRSPLRFSRVTTCPVREELLSFVEVAHIYALRPPKNTLYEVPIWPYHQALVDAVARKWSELQ